jgi:NitT/TauT family transport system substrate-binding protein
MSLKCVKLVNTSDSDIAAAFLNNPNEEAVVTWKPLVSQIRKGKGITTIFIFGADSRRESWTCWWSAQTYCGVPEGQNFAKAMTGAWYETMSQMSQPGTGCR